MHSSNEAARKRTSMQSPQRANQFSFPPTQRFDLLDSTESAAQTTRSADQRENLERSFENLLAAFDLATPLAETPA